MHDVESAWVGRVPGTGRGLKGELATGPARVGRLVGPALGIVSLLLFLLLAEVLLRALGYDHLYVNPQPARFWRHDALLGWHHQAAASGVFDHRPQFMTRIRINDKGLRGKDYPYERVAGKRRVLVLGDSLVFGYGVEQDEVFTDVLEGMLPATEVINAGVSGYGTDQELLWPREDPKGYERYGELVQRLRQRGFTTLDIDGAKGYAPDEMIIKDEGHWNALGHRFVARLIEPAIRGERP